MIPDDFMVCVASRAGDGGNSTAAIFGKVAQRLGYHVHEQRDPQSNISGLTAAFYIRSSKSPRYGKADEVDILIAFDGESFNERIGELRDGGIVIYDSSPRNPSHRGVPVVADASKNALFFGIPMTDLAKEHLPNPIMRNTIALGVLSQLLGIDRQAFVDFIEKQYGSKKRGQEIVASNLKAYDMGVSSARENGWEPRSGQVLVPRPNPGRLSILGDEAIAFGAIAAGCRFFGGYPITPASEIFERMMGHLEEFNSIMADNVRKAGGVAVQIESELAVISTVAGAAYSGVRAMTATSGPGFSLMQEVISACGMTETPVVIVNVQRGGPSSGEPTRTSQEDLNEAIFGGHGDFPRIVLSPATPEECFCLTGEAFNLAEKFQCPVIVLSEQCVGQGRYTVDDLDVSKLKIDRGKLLTPEDVRKILKRGQEYQRYLITRDGISPRAIPGTPDLTFMVNTYEHNELGFADEEIDVRNAQMEKRMRRKLAAMTKLGNLPKPVLHSYSWENEGDYIGFIGYGGVYGPVLEAMADLSSRGIPVRFLQLRTLWPFPSRAVSRFVKDASQVFVVEQNISGQLRGLIQREATGPRRKLKSILRYDTRPFQPKDIVEGVEKSLETFDRARSRSKLGIKGGA